MRGPGNQPQAVAPLTEGLLGGGGPGEFSLLAQQVAMGERSEAVLSLARQSEEYELWTTFQETLP